MTDVQRLRDVTANYPYLQGLRIVPLSIPFLFWGTARIGWMRWLPGSAEVRSSLWFLSVYTALAVAVIIGRRYERRFGRVHVRERAMPTVVVIALITVGLMWIQSRIWPDGLGVPLYVVFVGLALMWTGYADHGLRKHYIPIGALWLLVAALDLIGASADLLLTAENLVIAATLLIGGLCDHRVLVHALQPSLREAHMDL